MRLTLRLLHYDHRFAYYTHNMPYRYRGKYRRVREPQYIDLLRMRHDLEREERNMSILRHPYLSIEQSNGHMKEKTVPKDFRALRNQISNAKFRKDITIEDRLSHLNVTYAWD